VLDDADRAPRAVRAAAREVHGLVLATGTQPAALAELAPGAALVPGPLAAAGVRAIAGFYAPSGGAIPVETLAAASGGVPRRIHEAAGGWGGQAAARRGDEAAGRAAAGRSEARALQAELADSVADLQATRERAAHDEGTAPVVCPYK